MPLDDASAKRYARKSAFLEFCEKDGLSVITGYGVEDLKTAPLKRWEWWGGSAAYCHLEGSQCFVGVIVAEIPAGKGYSLMWPAGGKFVRVDWKPARAAGRLVPSSFHHQQRARPPSRAALRFPSGRPSWRPNLSEHEGGHLPEHEDEPPEIRGMYEAELKKENIPLRMKPIERAARF
jgi:hypothetical protein